MESDRDDEQDAQAFLGAALAAAVSDATVLSVLCVRRGDDWTVVAGSLLAMPLPWAYTSWSRWAEMQPSADRYRDPTRGFDLGPRFDAQPFAGVRILRTPLDRSEIPAVLAGLTRGRMQAQLLDAAIDIAEWSPTVLLTGNGATDAHKVVAGAQRPVLGVVGITQHPAMPPTESTWQWPLPPHLRPGSDLGAIAPNRQLLWWPQRLLGIDWLADTIFSPPSRFVVGRLQDNAWILGVRPNEENDQLDIHIGWNEQAVDPLGLSLFIRSERDGLVLLADQTRISDLPSQPEREAHRPDGVEARHRRWSERFLTVSLPRGPRRTDWGLALIAADGRLLDEWPVAPRVEQIVLSIQMGDEQGPPLMSVTGDRRDYPTRAEQDQAARARAELELGARRAAASRRFSDAGQIAAYLRWRFSCRAGELLLLDPYLLADGRADLRARDLAFMESLGRPIRALTSKLSREAAAEATGSGFLDLRRLPQGTQLHDRVWIVGDTALLLGGSINGFLPRDGQRTTRSTTASELPHADAQLWKERFEDWWTASPTR